jgi:acetylornithine/succinyldiaminopimelate/putrescine aminotransferase
MAASEDFDSFTRRVNPPLGRFLKVVERDFRFLHAEGCTLRTDLGETLTDWMSGFGTLSFGHNPPFAKAALSQALGSMAPHLYVEALNPWAGRLADALVQAAGTPFQTCFFANGGTEAVEAALKAAVAATGRSKILYADGAYHGTTLGALGCMAQGLYREPFEALLPHGFQSVPFGDSAALARALADEPAAAFLVEPIQMEAGARIASRDYLLSAKGLCQAAGSLLLLDEIQTGLGRTGKTFAFQHAGVQPDVVIVGKALGAGLVPISAALFGAGIWERAYGNLLRSEIHNSTLGGNALCCAVGLAVLQELERGEVLANVQQRSQQLTLGLSRVLEGRRAVRRVSLQGLLGGIQLHPVSHPWATWAGLGMPELEPRPSSAALLVQRLGKQGILAQVCGHDWSVLRIEPPLTVSAEACEEFIAKLGVSLDWLEENAFDK